MICFDSFLLTGRSNINGKIWLNARWKDEVKNFVYLGNTKLGLHDDTIKENMKIFDKNYMMDEIDRNVTENDDSTRALIYRKNDNHSLFSVIASKGNESKGITVCRAFPTVPIGIQTLNMMLDPEKSSERLRKTETSKNRYYNDFGKMDMVKSYDKLLELLWYTRLPCFDVKGLTSEKVDELSFIKRCYWRGKMIQCSKIFVTRPTDRGMCCGFNFDNAEKVFKNTKFTQSMAKLQKKARNLGFERKYMR